MVSGAFPQFDADASLRALLDGSEPFPWQRRLLGRFMNGDLPAALDLPTGLGKTKVIAIWLLARAAGAAVPRRLVYVVDRRAVVDQATAEAERLAERLGFGEAPCPEALRPVREALGRLSISTLRGRHADNRAWTRDPAAPAIVVGTVDMIGSRLLFSGYGIGARMRSMQAGLLGHDTLLVLDEAHLVPPFAALAEAVSGRADLAGREGLPVPRLRVMALSATLGAAGTEAFRLDEADRADGTVQKRIGAVKNIERLKVDPAGKAGLPRPEALVAAALELVGAAREAGASPRRVAVFCHGRATAEAVEDELRSDGGPAVILLTGARRVKERQDAEAKLAAAGFLPGGGTPSGPAILVATSAAEVGVDLDATDAVMDLVAWERMVQRLGRVNRRGEGEARVTVLDTGAGKSPEGADLAAVRLLLDALGGGASPDRIGAVARENPGRVEEGSTPRPLRPALTRPVLESWSLTGIDEHPGRPEVEPWLRGWVEEAEPQTRVIWRAHLPVRMEEGEDRATAAEVAAFFEAARPHLSEEIEAEVSAVLDVLKARLGAGLPEGIEAGQTVAVLLDRKGKVVNRWNREKLAKDVELLITANKDAIKKEPVRSIRSNFRRGTLVLDARLGGLAAGSLATKTAGPVPVADGDPGWPDLTGWTVTAETEPQREGEPEIGRFVSARTEEGAASAWLVVRRSGDAEEEAEEARSRARAWVTLADHTAHVEAAAAALARRLGLGDRETAVLAHAARLHDAGKAARVWQDAMARGRGRPQGAGPWAKAPGGDGRALAGYRHETASLLAATADPALAALEPEERDLALHLVASHHGLARPGIGTENVEDASPSRLEALALEAALRFARLERRFGPWGLAWWEAVFRAADQEASREEEGRDG
jgi:CRISPR-associated endonuclease/helicase Cas3